MTQNYGSPSPSGLSVPLPYPGSSRQRASHQETTDSRQRAFHSRSSFPPGHRRGALLRQVSKPAKPRRGLFSCSRGNVYLADTSSRNLFRLTLWNCTGMDVDAEESTCVVLMVRRASKSPRITVSSHHAQDSNGVITFQVENDFGLAPQRTIGSHQFCGVNRGRGLRADSQGFARFLLRMV